MNKTKVLMIFGVLIIALFLRMYNLGEESYWLDEANSIRQSQESFGKSMEMVKKDTHLPLYTILLHFWVHMFGTTEFVTRLLSVIIGVFSVVLIYFIGKKLFNANIGLIASLILALSPVAIYYSQETRLYNLSVFLTMLSFLYFIDIFEKISLRCSIFYILSSLLMLYTHIFSVFPLLAQNIYFIYHKRQRYKEILEWILLQFILLIFFLPSLLFLKSLIGKTHLVSWLPIPNLNILFVAFMEYIGNVFILIIFILLLSLIFFKRRNISLKHKSSIILLLLWAILPIFLIYIFSISFIPLFHIRYFLFIIPAIYLLFAWAISEIFKEKKIQTFFLILIIVSSLFSIFYQLNSNEKNDWRNTSLFLKENVKDGDIIFIYPTYHQDPFTYYFDDECFKNYLLYTCNYYKSNIISLGYSAVWNGNSTKLTTPIETNLTQLEDFIMKPIWLVEVRSEIYDKNNSLFKFLSENKKLKLNKTFGGGINIYKFN
ncbi:MAG: glycosyltransferase family 39 protein [Candidatus Woesearchaeota archaeon]